MQVETTYTPEAAKIYIRPYKGFHEEDCFPNGRERASSGLKQVVFKIPCLSFPPCLRGNLLCFKISHRQMMVHITRRRDQAGTAGSGGRNWREDQRENRGTEHALECAPAGGNRV